MKRFFTLFISLCLLSSISLAQSVPQGMKYQAVARDTKGQVIANRDLQLKITLYSDSELRLTQYTEIHKIITNELGLFSLTIGQGFNADGTFDKVPWSETDIWMEVAIQTDDDVEFITISDSRMLSVPYAFHAATASEIVGQPGGGRGFGSGPTGGVPSQVWTLAGNVNTDPTRDKLGTTDMRDLVVVTNDTERIRVEAHGNVNVARSLSINENLYVNENVLLNGEGGETINKGDFTVDDESDTYLTGELDVDGKSRLHNSLEVDGYTNMYSTLKVIDDTYLGSDLSVIGASVLKGTLAVDGNTDLNSQLNVDGNTVLNSNLNVVGIATVSNTTQATSADNGALVVDGGVGIAKDLYVGGDAHLQGTTTLDYLEITASNESYVAEINNLNEGNGDGLVIKLGRTHPAWNPGVTGDYLVITDPSVQWIDSLAKTVKGWVEGGGFSGEQLLVLNQWGLIPGTACNIINIVTDEVNSSLGLPQNLGGWHIWDATQIFPGINLDADEANEIPAITLPALDIPVFGTLYEIPDADCGDLPSFTLPNLAVQDVNNSLTSENQFISFRDKENRELGSISAQSVEDWQFDFFDGKYFTDLMGEVVGLDILSGVVGAYNKFSDISESYNQMGVTYNSGHGDYAEWLERLDHNENISNGDIVGVRGGKITKDLHEAEQIMAVSTRPIILGNTPPAEKTNLGHNIAFMGQIPVKVVGPVSMGDYIVGNPATPGYGIAVHPNDLTVEHTALIVGRTWEAKETPGPKMVNTVVGVDNGAFLKLIQQNKAEISGMNARVDQLEAKMNQIANSVVSTKK
jgi:hypothetical protein